MRQLSAIIRIQRTLCAQVSQCKKFQTSPVWMKRNLSMWRLWHWRSHWLDYKVILSDLFFNRWTKMPSKPDAIWLSGRVIRGLTYSSIFDLLCSTMKKKLCPIAPRPTFHFISHNSNVSLKSDGFPSNRQCIALKYGSHKSQKEKVDMLRFISVQQTFRDPSKVIFFPTRQKWSN